MAKSVHTDFPGIHKNYPFSNQPSVVGERGTAAIESNPVGPAPEEEEEEKRRRRGGSSSGGAAPVYYEAARLPTATRQEQYINEMYETKLARERAALEAAYDANVTDLNKTAAAIPGKYQTAANQTVGQAAVQRAAFHEQAAASGLNSGARGQAALAQNNALLGSLGGIRQAEAEALSEVEAQRSALRRQYQQQIAEAVAANEAERAAALYSEARRVDESIVATAVNQANENYKAWKARYG